MIALLDDTAQELEVAAVSGTRAHVVGRRFPLVRSLRETVIAPGRSFRSTDVQRDPRPLARDVRSYEGARVRALLVLPLRSREGTLGLFAAVRAVPAPFTQRDEAQLARLADGARLTIRNVRLRHPALHRMPAGRPPSPGPGEPQAPGSPGASTLRLTPREREIIGLLASDKTCKEVASLLALSTRTVEHHLERLKFRYHQSTLHGLVSHLVRQGL